MATAIENAREAIQKALETALPKAGLRKDDKLFVKRYGDNPDDTSMSMVPEDAPNSVIAGPLEIKVPEVKTSLYAGYFAKANPSGGITKTGDARQIKFVRYKVIEDFLKQTFHETSDELNFADGPYPEIEFFTFVLNGIEYRPVRWEYDEIFAKLQIARV